MKITIKHIVGLVLLSFVAYPFIIKYWETVMPVMIYFTFITNVAMWIITLRVYVFQQELKENMNTPFIKKFFGRKKHD